MSTKSLAVLAAVTLSAALAAGAMLPAYPQSNEQARQDQQAAAKQDHKADKAQAKADKDAEKALKSDKVKKAVRSQDKANAEAAKTPDR